MTALSPPFLRERIRDLRARNSDDRRAIGVYSAAGWTGGESIEVDAAEYRVVVARSPLEAREAMAEGPLERLVLITEFRDRDLGADVVARFVRGKLYSVDLRETVLRLFGAKYFDPSLKENALLEALVEFAPQDRYLPVASGILSAEMAWRSFFEFVLGVPDGVLDLPSLLTWTLDPGGRSRYEQAKPELADCVRKKISKDLGTAGAAILGFVDRGHGGDALALAAVCEALFCDPDDPEVDVAELAMAQARFEAYHGGLDLAAGAGRELAQAARELNLELNDLGRKDQLDGMLPACDLILKDIQAQPFAYRSSLAPSGFEGRLERLGGALLETSDKPADNMLNTCRELLEKVKQHQKAPASAAVVGRVEMACRLLRWLTRSASESPQNFEDQNFEGQNFEDQNFEDQAYRYTREGSFVDGARDALISGDELPTLSEAFLEIERKAYDARRTENEAFAKAASAWFAQPTPRPTLLPIEEAAEAIFAPILETMGRALIIVLDGMSWSVAHQILADLRDEYITAWVEGVPGPIVNLVATLPSITEISRTSLLSGELTRGNQQTEKKEFAQQPSLAAICTKKDPPLVLHKAELTEGGRGALTGEAKTAIASKSRKLVAVIINAIDDDLSGAQQVRASWNSDRIRPLKSLIHQAFEARRCVIFASDHGHVYHRPGAKIPAKDGGDRWRPPTGKPQEGEILVKGPRVRGADGATEVIVPWDEAIQYGKPKNGYHGGIALQELLAPVFVLQEKHSEDEKLKYLPLDPPEWWDLESWSEVAPRSEAVVIQTPPIETTESKKPGAAKTRTPVKSPLTEVWVESLFASETFRAQFALGGKHAPPEKQVQEVIELMISESGSMTEGAFASRVSVPIHRLPGFVSRLARILNVDGYEVFAYDRERNIVQLDVALLIKQFEIGSE